MFANRRSIWIGLALALGVTVAFSSTALAGSSVRDTVYVKGADLSVVVYPQPYSVTTGNDVAFAVSVSDRGQKAAHGVTLTDTIATGTSLVAVVPGQGSCTSSFNNVLCSLGDMAAGGHTTVWVVTTTPPAPQILGNTARVRLTSPNDPNKSNNHSSGYAQTYSPQPDEADGYVPPAGGTVGLPHHTTVAHPTTASVRGPRTTTGFPVDIYVYSPGQGYGYGCPDGAKCFGDIVEVDGMNVSVAHPATITLRYHSSEIPPGKSVLTTRVYDDGSIVPRCFKSAGGTAAPNPCVISRSVLANGDWKIVVRTAEGYAQFQL